MPSSHERRLRALDLTTTEVQEDLLQEKDKYLMNYLRLESTVNGNKQKLNVNSNKLDSLTEVKGHILF